MLFRSPPPPFLETYIDLRLSLYDNKFGSIGLFLGGFLIIWLIKLKNYIECFMFNGYCIICLFQYANIYKKKVVIVYFLESQYFPFHGEKSWIKHNYIFFFLV